MAHIERSMFREYDIRGRMKDTELNPEAAGLIGRAYGTFLETNGGSRPSSSATTRGTGRKR